MLFSSIEFIFCFLPLVFLVYFVLTKYTSAVISKSWLVLSSLFFYGYWEASYLYLILFSIAVNFGIGRLILDKKELGLSPKKPALIGVLFNVGLLGYFKYVDFFIFNINAAFSAQISYLEILLPLGISFFTFQQISYLIDCCKEETKKYDFVDYCLFVTFFPQLIAGPIVHHKQMMPQFTSDGGQYLKLHNVYQGILIFVIGLFKKVVIADTFAEYSDAGFSNSAGLSFFEGWLTSLSYTFQLYYDFSGYSDMAIGAALLFNIRLPQNFNSPYKALSIQDFWRRWHITLSTWLRDYIYIPLGGNKKGPLLAMANVFITMLIGGFWHGAGWTFILWGAAHGAALALHKLWRQTGLFLNEIAAWLLTFVFIVCSWVMFRAESLQQAKEIYLAMFGFKGFAISQRFNELFSWVFNIPVLPVEHTQSFFSTPFIWLFMAATVLGTLTVRNSLQITKFNLGEVDLRLSLPLVYGCAFSLAVIVMLTSPVADFLYFNF